MKLEDYKHLIAKAPFGYAYHKILLDDTGKPIDYEFIDINPAFERITGLESSQILHRKATEILSNREEAWSRIPVYGDIALHGGEKEFELYSEWNAKWYKVQIYSPEKNYFVTIYNALHSIDKTTRVRSKIPDVIDISNIKHTEEALRESEERLQLLLNSTPDIICFKDAQGRWLVANKADLELFSLTAMEKVRRAIMARERQTDPKRSYQENGEIFYEDITVYPLVANGVEGAVIRIDDVTDRVRLEEMMVQSEKMLSVGGLAAGMAHEINNPLAGIIQNVCNIENRLSDLHMPANLRSAELAGITMEAIHTFMESRGILRMVRNIKESGSRVAGIVENMLSFARKSEFAISPQNISDLLEKTLELAATDYDLKKQYDFKSIQIIKEYEENLPLVPCEASKIQQVFLNILSNGAQAMHGNIVKQKYFGEKFSPPCFILRLKKESNMLCIEMEDNGPGIEESIRKRIFEPFFTTKPAGAGTGLGLSVSYFIITETHGGSMSVESEAGNGTKFIIRLPLNKTGNML